MEEKEKIEVLKEYEKPEIIEKKDLKIELFSDEPDPWGPWSGFVW